MYGLIKKSTADVEQFQTILLVRTFKKTIELITENNNINFSKYCVIQFIDLLQ